MRKSRPIFVTLDADTKIFHLSVVWKMVFIRNIQLIFSASMEDRYTASVKNHNRYVTWGSSSEKHTFLSCFLANSRLPSCNKCFWDYSWGCKSTQRYLHCMNDREEREKPAATIIMPRKYGRYLETSRAKNQNNNIRYGLTLILVHPFSTPEVSKHSLVCSTSPPARLFRKQHVPCKLNNGIFIVMQDSAYVSVVVACFMLNIWGLFNACKSN